MKMTDILKKYVLPNLPYLIFLWFFAKVGEAVRLAPGVDASTKLLGLADGFTLAFQTSMPGAAVDWLVGLIGAAAGPPGGLCEREKCQKVPEGCGIRERPLGHESGYCSLYGPQAGK